MKLTEKQIECIEEVFEGDSKRILDKDIDVEIGGDAIDIKAEGKNVSVTLKSEGMLLRAMMLVLEKANCESYEYREVPKYDTLGITLDCSRNAVMKLDTFKRIIRYISKMGYNMCQLYMENTFELPGYPYFAYQRSAYTKEDLMQMDDYAYEHGVELMPAIETLGHLEQLLKWQAFGPYRDTGSVLMADNEKVYKLIEDILSYLDSCFRSKRINIGMDEAGDIGRGKHLDVYGYEEKGTIFLRHLDRVQKLCTKYGLSPIMWSDMFFRSSSPSGRYIDPNFTVTDELRAKIPKNVTLAHYSYRCLDRDEFNKMMDKHFEMTDRIMFAAGAWKWSGFQPNNLMTIKVAKVTHECAVNHNIREMLITTWGDDGAECSPLSVMPSLQAWAELCYTDKCEDDVLNRRFKLCCKADVEDFYVADKLNYGPGDEEITTDVSSASKFILYQDVLEGLFDAQIPMETYSDYYYKCYEDLDKAVKKYGDDWSYIFNSLKWLSKVLSIKCRVGVEMRKAYKAGDMDKLTTIAKKDLPELLSDVKTFSDVYSEQWLKENRIAGLDIFDIRIGGVEERVKTAIWRLNQYIDGEITDIEELDMEILPYIPELKGKRTFVRKWREIATPRDI